MADTDIVKQWCFLANEDLRLAEFASVNMWPTPLEIICYHCQQAVEKYLKAFLVLHGKKPPYIHDLVELLKQCETINENFSQISDKCSVLTEYGVRLRYPGELQIEQRDMNLAVNYAKEIYSFLQKESPKLFSTQENDSTDTSDTDTLNG
jgi:HEPN domain-containing protein